MSGLQFVKTTAGGVVTRLSNNFDSSVENDGGVLYRDEPVVVIDVRKYTSKVLCRLGVRWLINEWY
jgi:hypothetical protein